jgi:hypothetical protein
MNLYKKVLPWLFLLSASPSLYAANPCIDGGASQPRDGSGIGGTGHLPPIMGATDGSGMGGTGHGPVQQDGSGIGGTGHAPWKEARDGNGMGGTGHQPAQDGSGMGGTGHDTEVEGVITGFASICVNGLELHYQSNTPVTISGKAGSPKDLAVGQVVHARAAGKGEQFNILSLHVRHVMVGSLQAVAAGQLQAMGQAIIPTDGSQLPPGLARGQKVAISGFAGANGAIYATRIDAAPADSPDSLSGKVARDNQGHPMIGGLRLEGAGADLKPGEQVRVEGRFDNGNFHADRVERDLPPGKAERFVIQGPVKASGKDRLNIGEQQFKLDSAGSAKTDLPKPGQWVRVEGRQKNDELLIQKLQIQERVLPNRGRQVEISPANQRPQTGKARESRETGSGETSDHHGETREHSSESRERSEKSERSERSEKAETPEKPEKVEAPERPEKIEAPEKPEKVEAPEKPEKVEVPEKPEKIETPEKPEKIEAPEKPEKIEIPEKREAERR